MDEYYQQQPNGQPSEYPPPPEYPSQQVYLQTPYYYPMYNRPVGFIEASKAYWKNYFNFNDRTSRAGYWWAFLMFWIITIIICIMIGATGEPDVVSNIFAVWILANLIPMLSITVRRLHDVDKGWVWIFIRLIPIVGDIILIVITATAQKLPPENRFAYLPQV